MSRHAAVVDAHRADAVLDARALTLALSGTWRGSYGTAACPVCQLERRPDQTALTLADGRVEETDWAEVMEVEVFTTRTGPHAAAGGVIMVGDGETRGCLGPLDQAASSGLIDHLCRLPGFDLNRFVEASQARPPTRTPVWRREPR